MAINYSVSYTFSPNTTIQSSQVNTNFSDNSNTWTGLEAKTKSFSNLQVDTTPTASTDVAIKSYVDKLNAYRRPVLQYNSVTVVNVETGLDGTSGDCAILFPDGTKRTDTATGRIQCNLGQVAALSGTWQSGLRTGTVAANTWYAIYAVKTTDDAAKMVMVADTVLPIQANFSTLNTNFGTNGWVYLGCVPYGDNSGATTAVPKFVMAGNMTILKNQATGNAKSSRGLRLATSGSGTSLSFNYATGTNLSTPQVPNNFTMGLFGVASGTVATATLNITGPGNSDTIASSVTSSTNAVLTSVWHDITDGINIGVGNAAGLDIFLAGWIDGALGIGANPLL